MGSLCVDFGQHVYGYLLKSEGKQNNKRYFDQPFKDPFNFEPIDEELEPWNTIARECIQEVKEEREEKISKFLEGYRTDPEIAKWRVPEDGDKWEKRERLIKFLRAGAWDVEMALAILRNY